MIIFGNIVMLSSILLGNIFSFFSAICIAVSAMQNSKKKFMLWQVGDAASGILANITLSAHSALVISIICLIRNFLSYKNCLTSFLTAILFILSIFIGIYANNLGFVGYLPIVASASYTICIYITKNEQQMRLALIFNMLLWAIHNFYVQAYPSAVVNVFLCFWSAFQAYKKIELAARNLSFTAKT